MKKPHVSIWAIISPKALFKIPTVTHSFFGSTYLSGSSAVYFVLLLLPYCIHHVPVTSQCTKCALILLSSLQPRDSPDG